MPREVQNANIYRADPTGPTKRWVGEPIATAAQVAVHDEEPRVTQPFQLARGSSVNDFVVGNVYWMIGATEEFARVAWTLTLADVRPAGKDVMLVGRSA